MTDRRSSIEGRNRKMLSALHATVSVIELPTDAPSTIRDLTIDVTDPLKIYTIYRASRRYGFQSLVERLVVQLRYGCEHHECSTHTCFTYRARAAGSRPLRRYNAASARALACYLASQDNSSTQLCQYICDGSPAHHAKLPVKALQRATTREPSGAKGKLPIHKGLPNIHKQNLRDRAQSAFQPPIRESAQVVERACYSTRNVDKGLRIDHKSFVQNIFSTVSFRLLEWLTPTGVSALLSAELGGSSEKLSDQSRSSSSKERVDLRTSELSGWSSSASDEGYPADTQDDQEGIKGISMKSDHTLKGASSWQSSSILDPSQEVASGKSHFSVQANDFESMQNPSQANIDHQNASEMPGKPSDDPKTSALGTAKPLVTSSGSRQSPVLSQDRCEQTIDLTSGRDKSKTTHSHDVVPPKLREQVNGKEPDRHLPKSSTGADNLLPPQTLQAPTQSLGLLSCEIIEELQAMCIQKNPRSSDSPESRMEADIWSVVPEMKQRSTIHWPCDWTPFVQQSMFYVLSDSTLLLRSFRDSHGSIINSRLTALSLNRLIAWDKPLVLDSLWVSAEHLYTPPKTDRPCVRRRSNKTSLSNSQAAELTVICLRSLIATVSQETGDQVLLAAPVLPSYGLARPLFKASGNLLEERLQQNDAFSDELALRLARRIFSAIPVRLQFQNLALLDTEEEETDSGKTLSFMDKLIDLFVSPGSGSLDDKSSPDALVQTDIGLLVDWARIIMYQDWNGSAEVPMDGAFGGALVLVAALYDSQKRFIGVEWKMDIFTERLNELEVPYQWLGFTENKRTKHLLDYPFLFSTSILVTYFRSCNYYQMCKAFETAEAMKRHVNAVSAPTMLLTDTNRRIQLNEQLETALYQYLVLRIRRSNVLEDTFNQLWRRQVRELLRPLKIRLGEGEEGEEGMDSGGVQQEFFRLAIAEALNPDFGAFTADGSSHMSWFQPGSPEPLWKFELIGVIVSLAVYNGLTLPVTFPKVLYAKLLGVPMTFDTESIIDGWRDLAKSLDALLNWDESKQGLISEVLCRAYEFSAPLFEVPVSCEMKEDSNFPKYGQIFNPNHDVVNHQNPTDTRLVDGENRYEFVRNYIQWLTDVSIRPQFEAFRRGFISCLEHRSLTLLNPASLQSLVEGEQEIDMNGLRKYARYEGYEPTDRTIKQFWSIVSKYSDSEKRSLLEFVTASDRIPVGGISNVTFLIVKNGTEEMDGHLPTAYTCYGTLLLPQYSSKEILKEKLALALENSKGFGFA